MNSLKAHENYIYTKSSKVNIRSGPDSRYVVKFIYIKKNTILRIKNTFDEWYETEDMEGDSGWVYKNLVSKQKKIKYTTVMSRSGTACYNNTNANKKITMKVSYLVNLKLKECNDTWCLVEKNNLTGWCKKKHLWGVN
jgi:SH3-like domain-containing protein